MVYEFSMLNFASFWFTADVIDSQNLNATRGLHVDDDESPG